MKLYSPWAEVDAANAIPLNPRLDTLEGKTIGLYAHFKGHSPVMLEILSELLKERFPTTKFKAIQIKRDTMEAFKLPEFDAELKESDLEILRKHVKDTDGFETYSDLLSESFTDMLPECLKMSPDDENHHSADFDVS